MEFKLPNLALMLALHPLSLLSPPPTLGSYTYTHSLKHTVHTHSQEALSLRWQKVRQKHFMWSYDCCHLLANISKLKKC